MSLSTLLFLGLCWGSYRLGQFNERFPGVSRQYALRAWERLHIWLKRSS